MLILLNNYSLMVSYTYSFGDTNWGTLFKHVVFKRIIQQKESTALGRMNMLNER